MGGTRNQSSIQDVSGCLRSVNLMRDTVRGYKFGVFVGPGSGPAPSAIQALAWESRCSSSAACRSPVATQCPLGLAISNQYIRPRLRPSAVRSGLEERHFLAVSLQRAHRVPSLPRRSGRASCRLSVDSLASISDDFVPESCGDSGQFMPSLRARAFHFSRAAWRRSSTVSLSSSASWCADSRWIMPVSPSPLPAWPVVRFGLRHRFVLLCS